MYKVLASAAFSVLALAGASGAATFTNSFEIDLAKVSITDDSAGGQLILGTGTTTVPVTTFAPQAGDVLQTTVTFARGARLKIIDGPNTITKAGSSFFESLTFGFTNTAPGSWSASTTSVLFQGLQGSLINSKGRTTGILGQGLNSSQGDVTDDFISFTGLTMTTTVTSSANVSVDGFELFGGRAGGFEVMSPAAVPLPASVWLLGAAVGALRLRARRIGNNRSD